MEEDLNALERERNYVIENQDAIRQQYGNSYLAVKDESVIDHDSDKFKLARRIEEKHRDQVVLISSLEDVLNPREVHLDSPELG
jgi:hypothetical protein